MGGGKSSFTPIKRADGNNFSNVERGCTKSSDIVLTWVLEVLAMLKGAQKVSTL